MTSLHGNSWLDLLESSCADASLSYLDIIIDQVGSTSTLLPSVRSVEPPLLWYSLFTGLPEEGAEDLAPLLVRVNLKQPLQRHWLMALMHHLKDSSQLLVLASQWPFQVLARHLSRCLEVHEEGYISLFRYYDPRLFPQLFSHALDAEQQQLWLRPAVFWSWLDRDGTPRHLPGTADSPESVEPFKPIELSARQMDILTCSSEAALMIESPPCRPDAQQRFQTCFTALLEATEAGVVEDAEREAFALDRLRNAEIAPTVEERK